MRTAIIENGVVVNIVESEGQLPDNWIHSENACIGDYWDGESFKSAPIKEVITQKQYDDALMSLFDDAAKAMNYMGWQTCAMRAYKPGPFEVECTAFFDWMETCNMKGYATLADVISGKIPQPSVQEFIQSMPAFVRPTIE